MFTLSHALETSATPEQVWKLLEEPRRWPEWMTGLLAVSLPGPASLGATGKLRFDGQGTRTFRLEKLQSLTELQWVVLGFGRVARFRISLIASPMGTRLTQRVEVQGAGAWMDLLFRRKRLAQRLPDSTRALARVASTQ